MQRHLARLFAWLSVSTVLAAGSSCAIIAGVPSISDGGSGGSATGATCKEDKECDDNEPCTADSCGADNLCVRQPVADGTVLDASFQTTGDCKQVVCRGGKSVSGPDTVDFIDQGNDCTTESCGDDGPTSSPNASGTVCKDASGNTGKCDGDGACVVECVTALDCVNTNPCKVAACDPTTNTCVFGNTAEGMPTPGVTQEIGDCHVRRCVNGADTDEVDDTDLPVPTTDCFGAVCMLGFASTPPKALATQCSTYMMGQAGFCDGNGTCQQCAVDGHCSGKIDDCQHPVCTQAFTCDVAFTDAMTPTVSDPAQTAGDCATLLCDGMGNAVVTYDTADPANDGNVCKADVCTAVNMTSHNNVANGTACGMNLSCVNGACTGCTLNSQCNAASCAGTVLTKAQTCNGMGQCVSPTPATQNCAPNLCTNGACGTSCTNDTQCASTGYCAAGVCATKKAAGSTCTGTNQCTSGFCAVINGVCCTADCPVTLSTTCGTTGSCSATGACQRYDNTTACSATSCTGSALTTFTLCDGAGSCSTGAVPGACPGNLVCMNATACFPACGPGSPVGDNRCTSGYYCDGNAGGGSCLAKRPFGSSCSRSGECSSGQCVAMVCN